MKKVDVKVSFSKNKLNATILHLDKKGLDFQAELEDSIQKLYEKHVPVLVREYIESSEEIENSDKKKSTKAGNKTVDISSKIQDVNVLEKDNTNNFEDERKH